MHSRDLETKYSPLLSQLTVIHPQSKRMNGARSLEIIYPQLQAVASATLYFILDYEIFAPIFSRQNFRAKTCAPKVTR